MTDAEILSQCRLAHWTLMRLWPRVGRTLPLEDAEQTALVALVNAAKKYQPARGRFSTYLYRAIRNELVRADCDDIIHVPSTAWKERHLYQAALRARHGVGQLPEEDADDIIHLARYDRGADSRLDATTLLATLQPHECYILRRFYGIDCQPQSAQEIGKPMGLSRESVRRIIRESILQLRRAAGVRGHMPVILPNDNTWRVHL